MRNKTCITFPKVFRFVLPGTFSKVFGIFSKVFGFLEPKWNGCGLRLNLFRVGVKTISQYDL